MYCIPQWHFSITAAVTENGYFSSKLSVSESEKVKKKKQCFSFNDESHGAKEKCFHNGCYRSIINALSILEKKWNMAIRFLKSKQTANKVLDTKYIIAHEKEMRIKI